MANVPGWWTLDSGLVLALCIGGGAIMVLVVMVVIIVTDEKWLK